MTYPTRRVIGAGPAGLVAAAMLARAGEGVEVWERAGKVAGRFAGDFQGFEAWTDDRDLATRLAALGVEPTLPAQPVREVTFHRPVRAKIPAPIITPVPSATAPDSVRLPGTSSGAL
jgi:2-polyprenyl-6-methoxyphenol hydroxylase-like FAD-dependent oxidoreductase